MTRGGASATLPAMPPLSHPLRVSPRRDSGLDPSAAARRDRLSPGGEPRPAGATRPTADAVQRPSTGPLGGESQEAESARPHGARSHRHPRYLFAWHRTLIARQYDGSHRRGPGRPGVMAQIRQLAVRMATENRLGLYADSGGARQPGSPCRKRHIANILKRHGIEPAPRAPQADDLAGVSAQPLERPCRRRFLHGRSLDRWPTHTIRRALRDRSGDAPRRDCRHRVRTR